MTPMNVAVPVTLADRVDDTAVRRGITKAELIREALVLGLDTLDAGDGQMPGQMPLDPTGTTP